MNGLPSEVKKALGESSLDIRTDLEVNTLLEDLGASASPLFSILYASYQGPFASDQTGFELLDIKEGFDNILNSTKMIREEFDMPNKYLVLSNLLGGSVLILDTISDCVFNVDFEGGCEELIEGNLQPSWSSFSEFLKWYFG